MARMKENLELVAAAVAIVLVAVGMYLLARLYVWVIVTASMWVGERAVALALAAWWFVRLMVKFAWEELREGDREESA